MRDDAVEGVAHRGLAFRFGRLVSFDLVGALEDDFDGVAEAFLKCFDAGELLPEFVFVGRGDTEARWFVDGSGSFCERDTKFVSKGAERGLRDHARRGADAGKAFGSGEGVGRTSSGDARDLVGELGEVAGGVVGDALEDRFRFVTEGAKGRDTEGDENSLVVLAEVSVLFLLFLFSSSKGVLDGLAAVLWAKLVADADVEGDGVAVVSGEEEIGAVGARTFGGGGAGLRVFDVGFVKEVLTAAAGVLAKFARFLFDVGVACVKEPAVEQITNCVVAFGDCAALDGATTDDVFDPVGQGERLRLHASDGGEVVRKGADADAAATGAGVGGVRRGRSLFRNTKKRDAEVGTEDVFRHTCSWRSKNNVLALRHVFKM